MVLLLKSNLTASSACCTLPRCFRNNFRCESCTCDVANIQWLSHLSGNPRYDSSEYQVWRTHLDEIESWNVAEVRGSDLESGGILMQRIRISACPYSGRINQSRDRRWTKCLTEDPKSRLASFPKPRVRVYAGTEAWILNRAASAHWLESSHCSKSTKKLERLLHHSKWR